MSGVLYIVATPIGNLDDITLRAIDTLRNVDLIAAEDTRYSQRLLGHLGIRKPMISVHQHNENHRWLKIIERLEDGKHVALISDAGTPLISDPGFPLVRAAREHGIRVCPVPGASAIIAALSAAGMPVEPFLFAGFLSSKHQERLQSLRKYSQVMATLVFLESSHRIERLLQQLNEVMEDRPLVVAKELTKSHENFLRGNASDILRQLAEDPALCKGEFVVLVDNHSGVEQSSIGKSDEDILNILLEQLPMKKAVKVACQLRGAKRNDLYRIALSLKKQTASEDHE